MPELLVVKSSGSVILMATNKNPNESTPALRVITGGEQIDIDLDEMVKQICLHPFDDATWAFVDKVLDQHAPRKRHLKSV